MSIVTPALLVGRDAELATLRRVLDDGGPRVCFVYGIAGIGKSTLLARFHEQCVDEGVPVAQVDCRTIEPTPASCIAALRAAGVSLLDADAAGTSADTTACSGVVLIDTYEVFRIADPWLRHELLPALGPSIRVVVAGREPPMLEWAIERGQIGGLEVLPLGPSTMAASARFYRLPGSAKARPPPRSQSCVAAIPLRCAWPARRSSPEGHCQQPSRCSASFMRLRHRSAPGWMSRFGERLTLPRCRVGSRGACSRQCSATTTPTKCWNGCTTSPSSMPPQTGCASTTRCSWPSSNVCALSTRIDSVSTGRRRGVTYRPSRERSPAET